ncbi:MULTISPECIES: DUF2189 domain-containing protein [unclassified Methylobacterium]|uniref:DUF2189 domain-containing protein n=1 Tax=unclassified Methylobacterium TaxID=2615210 RepID=UPI000152CE1C|nr:MULTISPECIES: DUF2189 domain-containing protein [Methylobacterium]WFT77566.1 DUF2189 domain-containing protein [Methylobacterium nodulans]
MTMLHAEYSHQTFVRPRLRSITRQDLLTALARGFEDFVAMPTHVIFLIAIYPIAGIIIAAVIFEYDLIPILFPLASGFALIGPFAAVGLYELSRRREQGLDTAWTHAYELLTGRNGGAIAAVGFLLMLILIAWLIAAMGLYWALFGRATHDSVFAFAEEVLTTPRGWMLIVFGNLVGAAFSLVALAVSAVSFPLIIDRGADAGTAIETSVALLQENPLVMILWGLIVAGLLVIGMVPLFVGLALVLPILGHATWHLYRRAVLP